MEYLYRLYSNDYFGVGLVIVISILAISFLVILFFGKKDEKARRENNIKAKEEQINKIEEEKKSVNQEILKSLDEPNFDEYLEKKEDVNLLNEDNDIYNEIEDDEDFSKTLVSMNRVLESDYHEQSHFDIEEEISPISSKDFEDEVEPVSSVERKREYQSPIFEEDDYNDLSMNFDTSDEVMLEQNVIEEPESDFKYDMDETSLFDEPEENDLFKREDKDREMKRTTMPTQFSSVYLSKDKEEDSNNDYEAEPIVPISKSNDFDMPKPFDLPKLNKESNLTSNDNIINTKLNSDNENLDSLFKSLEEDSFTLKK